MPVEPERAAHRWARLFVRGRAPLWAVLLVVAWGGIVWTTLRPHAIVSDWHGWRQADTQTIALNFVESGTNILWPQIAWGGSGPGYVETEFQLYPRILSLIMRVYGPSEWAGQLVSLLAIVTAALIVFVHLRGTRSPIAALIGMSAFLAARTAPHLATVVMPDGLALLWYVAAWTCFCRYVATGRTAFLIAYGAIGLLAMLTKPTTAQLGISSAVFVFATDRSRTRDAKLWVTWALMLLGFALFLSHAHRLYLEYGNTFGLLSGEDSKVPGLRYVLMPRVWTRTARLGLAWGLGPLAALALGLLAIRRRLTPEHIALAIGNAVVPVIALRYMSESAGLHYWAPGALLAASAVASLCEDVGSWRFRRFALATVFVLVVVQGYTSATLRQVNERLFTLSPPEARVVVTGIELRRRIASRDLILVRSPRPAVEVFWHQAMNYHDPRIFYITGTHGWTIASDDADTDRVARAASEGARWLADPVVEPNPRLEAWLRDHAELVWSQGGGRIWRLTPAGPHG